MQKLIFVLYYDPFKLQCICSFVLTRFESADLLLKLRTIALALEMYKKTKSRKAG